MRNKKSVILMMYGLLYVVLFGIIAVLALKIVNVKKYEQQITLGDKYLDKLDYENAELCYLAALEINEKKIDAYVQLSEVYMDREDYDAAYDILDRAKLHVSEEDYETIKAYRNKVEEKQSQTEMEAAPEVNAHPELEAYRSFLSNDNWIDVYESDYIRKDMAVFDLGLDGVYEVALYYEGSSWQNYTTGLLSYSDGRLISDMSYSEGNMGDPIGGIDEQNGRYILERTRGKAIETIMQFIPGGEDYQLGSYFQPYFHRNGGHQEISIEQEYDQYIAAMRNPNYVSITPENMDYFLSGNGAVTGTSEYSN